jgi:hypothetical protein
MGSKLSSALFVMGVVSIEGLREASKLESFKGIRGAIGGVGGVLGVHAPIIKKNKQEQ